jgi:hypothetical protein
LQQIGNVAPVDPETLFYPVTPLNDPVQRLQDFGLRAPGVMRALGSVEAARVTIRERVSVKEDTTFKDRDDGDHVMGLAYDYSISGVELGLQGGDGLTLAVEGACFTEYGWVVDDPEEQPGFEVDVYNLWGDPNKMYWVPLNPNDIRHAPKASFYTHPLVAEQLFLDSNVSYAVKVDSAWRSSISEGSDPWYATQQKPERDGPDRYNAAWRMKRRRPILSCWEKDTWGYEGQNVTSVFKLKGLPNMKIPAILLEVLETTFGSGPMIVRLGNASGDSALRSRTTSPNGVINAQASRIYDDMERLILASFVASRGIFTDATMFGRTTSDGYRNLFTADNGQPATGAGLFVVSSPNIQTFSLTGIVTLAVILLALLLADTVVWALVHVHTPTLASDEAAAKDRWTRYHVLAAAQLFRCLYEKIEDAPVATPTPTSTSVDAEKPAVKSGSTPSAVATPTQTPTSVDAEKPAPKSGSTPSPAPRNPTPTPTSSTRTGGDVHQVGGIACWSCDMEIPNCGDFRLAPCPRTRGGGCGQSGKKCMGHINRSVTCCKDGKPASESPV